VFIDDHCKARWVEQICKVLPIAPSIHHDHVVKRALPERLWRLAKRGPRTEARDRVRVYRKLQSLWRA
jgi:hypothetical protein